MAIFNSGFSYLDGNIQTQNGIQITSSSLGITEFENAQIHMGRSGVAPGPNDKHKFVFVITSGSMWARELWMGQGSYTWNTQEHYKLGECTIATGMDTDANWDKSGGRGGAGAYPDSGARHCFTGRGGELPINFNRGVMGSGWGMCASFSQKKDDNVATLAGYIDCKTDTTEGGVRMRTADGNKTVLPTAFATDTRARSNSVSISDTTCSNILNVLEPKLIENKNGSRFVSFEFEAAKSALATVGTSTERSYFVDGIAEGTGTQEILLGDYKDAEGNIVSGFGNMAELTGDALAQAKYEMVEYYGGEESDYNWTANGNTRPVYGYFDHIRVIPMLVGAHRANRARLAAVESNISTEIAALVDSSPDTLNTLNELAAALGDDANFAATTTAAIGAKLDASAASAFGLTLIDDADAAAARTTLGLGTAATTAATDYATAAQGATADAALPAAGAQAALSVDHLITLSGVAESADDLGTFTGSIITDNSTVKVAVQELETEVETKADLDGANIPGPYNNDTEAATGGVAVNGIYRNNNGTIHWRVS